MKTCRSHIPGLMRISIAILVTGSLLLPSPARVAAANTTITVNTTADEVTDKDDLCSLREAIIAIDTGSPFGGCPAGVASNVNIITLADGQTLPIFEGVQ